MRRLLLTLLCLAALFGPGSAPAGAEEFTVPGLEADATAYADGLRARVPAGITQQAQRQAEQRAADAQRRNDWAGAAAALEARIGAGDATADLWLALARAQLRRTPPDPAHAAQAAWQAFSAADAGAGEIPSLLVHGRGVPRA